MPLALSTLVDINTSIATGGAIRNTFGRGLLVTVNPGLSAGGSDKVQLFNSLAAVTTLLGAGDATDAAAVWFGADPQPQGLYIGRWAPTITVNSSLAGGTPAVATDFTSATYSFAINGVDVTAIDLSTPTTYAAFATAIQLRLVAAGLTGATMVYDAIATAFVLTLGSSNPINPPYLTDAATGTDIAGLLAMGQTDNPTYIQGQAPESFVEAVGEMLTYTASSPVALFRDRGTPDSAGTPAIDTDTAMNAFAQAGDFIAFPVDESAQALVSGDTTSASALAFSASQGKVAYSFNNTTDALPEIGLAALMSAQNLGNRASIITPHAKAVPGVVASIITDTQYEELKRKQVNVVASVAGISKLLGGYTSQSGYWLDAQWWLLWLKSRMEAAIFNALGSSRRLTTGILTDTVTQVLQLGISNGGIEPGGTVGAATKADIISVTGNQDFDGTLTSGYLLWVQRPSVRTDIDRANRIGRFKAWLAPAEAIHEIFGDIVLSG